MFSTFLTSKCALRHNGVHLFDISASKRGPSMVCFVHFDFEMCFVPQRRAPFRHRNFSKCSDAEVFCTFWLRNVLRATTACAFLTSQLSRSAPMLRCLHILTWKCASRHNGVQLFISHLTTWLRTRRFSELLFDPPEQNHGKTQCFATFLPWKNTMCRDFPTFSRAWIFFLLTLSLFDLLSSSLLFSDSSHLCFSSVHMVGSLTSKLPSINIKKFTRSDNELNVKNSIL